MESLPNIIIANSLSNFKFTKTDINNYKVNDKSFKSIDNKLIIQKPSSFFNLFINNNRENYEHLTRAEQVALPLFVNYIGGLRKDHKSNLYKAVNYWQSQYKDQNVEGQGISYVFLSSVPNILVQKLEVLIGEYFAGNKKQHIRSGSNFKRTYGSKWNNWKSI